MSHASTRRRLAWMVAAALSLSTPALADRWLGFEAAHADAIAICNPTPGKIEDTALTTYNWPRGVITFKSDGPGFQLDDGGLAMKFHWERRVPGVLAITGRGLDGQTMPLRARIPSGYGEEGFQATSVIFGGPGCWEVTGRVGRHALVFRVYVIQVEDPATAQPLAVQSSAVGSP